MTDPAPPTESGPGRSAPPTAPASPGWREALLFALGLVLAALAAEGAARALAGHPLEKGGYSPVRGHRSREPVNSAGYRDLEHARAKPKGVHRIAFVGDSFTYGVGVLFDDTYPSRVGRALSLERGERWESIVLAQPGLDTQQEEEVVEQDALAYDPDVLVLGYVLNDAEDVYSAERRRAAEWENRERGNPPFWRHSALLRLLADRLDATTENRARIENHLQLYREGSAGFRASVKSLQNIGSLCRERKIPFVVVLFPLFANPLGSDYPFTAIHQKVEAASRSAGAIFLDLLPYYRGMDWRLLVVEGGQDEHPNELAHRIAAQALLKSLASVLPSPKHPEPQPAQSPAFPP